MARRAFRRTLLATLLVGVAAGACAQTPGIPSLEVLLDGAQRALGNLEGSAPAEALPPPEPEPAEPRFTAPINAGATPVAVRESGGLISLSVRDATLRQVLAALAETQNLNLIVAAPADTPVTAEFKGKPLREVLNALLSSTGHTWTEQEGVIVVTSVATGGELSPMVQGRRVAVIELDFASSADLQPAVEGLLSAVGQSHFIETDSADNRRTKELLIVEDLHHYVTRIEHYVAEADRAPRQVLIEVNLLQVDLEDEQRCGVDFNALSRIAGTNLTLGTSGLSAAYDFNGTTPGFFIEQTGGDLGAVLEALITTTDAKSVASPRILAVNGQESRIQIGEEIGYNTTTTTANGVTSGDVQFLNVGVILAVTPRITRDGRVLLRVAPEVSTGAINPDTGAPDKQTTNLATNALLHSGQGMIIGGLIQERDAKQIDRVPLLGSIPYINGLFQRRAIDKRRSELIVALVPHVLPYGDPGVACREERELFRAREPLLHGPLCKNPRPYEPNLYDPYRDERRFHVFDRRDPGCDPACETVVPCHDDGCPIETLSGPRRLPSTDDDEPAPSEPSEPEEIAARPASGLLRLPSLAR